MILSRNTSSSFILGGCIVASLTASSASADDYVSVPSDERIGVDRIADHCAQFGLGFVDLGNGVCGRRVTAHVRVYVGTRNAAIEQTANPWVTSGTASAALRTDSMVPGVTVTHLRVHGGLDSLNPFP